MTKAELRRNKRKLKKMRYAYTELGEGMSVRVGGSWSQRLNPKKGKQR